jgi:uncharacterized BrkB/YihY/UPF0761 family membrane protein
MVFIALLALLPIVIIVLALCALCYYWWRTAKQTEGIETRDLTDEEVLDLLNNPHHLDDILNKKKENNA